MIVYKPSIGNSVTTVGVNSEGNWFGQSLGGPVLDYFQEKQFPNTRYYSELDNNSTWFFDNITDWNFINGSTLYRCIYVGSSEKYQETEILGQINSIITNDSNNILANNSVQVDMWSEGIFNNFNSKNSIVLFDEQDSTNILNNATWSTSILSSAPLKSGEYVKIWVRLRVDKNLDLLEIDDFRYFLNIGALTIPLKKERGRLNSSKVYSSNIDDTMSDIVLLQTLPSTFKPKQILNSYYFNNLLNVIFIDEDNKLFNIMIQENENINDNKYLLIDLSNSIENLVVSDIDYLFSSFMTCETTPTTSTPTTSTSTTGTTGEPFYYESLINKKLFIKNFVSNTNRNNIYIFYNTLTKKSDDLNTIRYGYEDFKWDTSIIKIDINEIDNNYFSNLSGGFDNVKTITLSDFFDYNYKENFYVTNVELQDDLFTVIGIIAEDCRNTNFIPKLIHLWEGEILKEEIVSQELFLPDIRSNLKFTCESVNRKNSFLKIHDQEQLNVKDNNFNRQIVNSFGIDWVKMGPQNQKHLKVGNSPVSYDLMGINKDEYSLSTSFSLGEYDIVNNTESSSSSGNNRLVDNEYPILYHVKNKDDLDFTNSPLIRLEQETNYSDKLFNIFNVICNGDESNSPIQVFYNFSKREWSIYKQDKNENYLLVKTIGDAYLSINHENTITLNIFRQKVYGCSKVYQIYFNLFVNGKHMITDSSYSFDVYDDFTVILNPSSDYYHNVSYIEVKNYLEKEAEKYSKAFFDIHSNKTYVSFENERRNRTESLDLQRFNFRRNILINNLDWGLQDEIVLPIVIQGSSYNLSDDINENVKRSVFDFKKINLANKDFAFTLEGSNNQIPYITEKYNIDKNILVVWIRLVNWSGQRVIMYYNDSKLVEQEQEINNPFFNYYAVWNMETIINKQYQRYSGFDIFNSNNLLIYSKDKERNYLTKIDQQYLYGNKVLYRSNMIDIEYDDTLVNIEEREEIDGFIRDISNKFIPSRLSIRNIESKFDRIIDPDNNQ